MGKPVKITKQMNTTREIQHNQSRDVKKTPVKQTKQQDRFVCEPDYFKENAFYPPTVINIQNHPIAKKKANPEQEQLELISKHKETTEKMKETQDVTLAVFGVMAALSLASIAGSLMFGGFLIHSGPNYKPSDMI